MAHTLHPDINARTLVNQLLTTTSRLEEVRRELELCLGLFARRVGTESAVPSQRTMAPDAGPAALAHANAPEARALPNLVRKEGEYWTITYEGTLLHLRDSKGLDYLACLLRHPRQDFHVADLMQMGRRGHEAGAMPNAERNHRRAITPDGHAGDVLDARARAEYRGRVKDLRAELEQATESGDLGRASRAQQEIELITKQLAAAYGLHGRARRATDPVERLRKAVGNRINATLEKIREQHASLALHLVNAIRTGVFCSYTPERPLTWES